MELLDTLKVKAEIYKDSPRHHLAQQMRSTGMMLWQEICHCIKLNGAYTKLSEALSTFRLCVRLVRQHKKHRWIAASFERWINRIRDHELHGSLASPALR